MKFTEKTRKVIAERAKGVCEMCGMVIFEAAQIHHRQARGMGGTKKLESRSAANGLYLHFKCHEKIERHRATAYENGWLVHKWEDSTEIPVLMVDNWVLLDDDGGFRVVQRAWDQEGKPVPRPLSFE